MSEPALPYPAYMAGVRWLGIDWMRSRCRLLIHCDHCRRTSPHLR